jgi:alkylation response protein AidB-like acyl-CoA dehydrogenase
LELKQRLLPMLCSGDTFATVGISHFTTSRQHLREPAVRVRATDAGFALNGTVPWVTGANHADWIVTGGALDDGRQILAALSTSTAGVIPNVPPRMLALNGSQTGSVELKDVEIEAGMLLGPPAHDVMKRGTGGGAGSFATSALAIGATAGTLRQLQAEAEPRPDLVPIHAALSSERSSLSDELRQAVEDSSNGSSGPSAAESIRQRANSLVLRASQSYLAASKGAGFICGHPAERAVREATFFLVWSCPQPVLAATLREFACALG